MRKYILVSSTQNVIRQFFVFQYILFHFFPFVEILLRSSYMYAESKL